MSASKATTECDTDANHRQEPPAMFHAHFFFDAHEHEAANNMREALISLIPEIEIGPFLPRAEGPLPSPMFMVTFSSQFLASIIEFIQQHREGRSVLVHPLAQSPTEEYAAHTTHAQWFGTPLRLLLDRL